MMVVTCLVYNLECSSFEQYDTGVDFAYRVLSLSLSLCVSVGLFVCLSLSSFLVI